jgi:hypothetical protein
MSNIGTRTHPPVRHQPDTFFEQDKRESPPGTRNERAIQLDQMRAHLAKSDLRTNVNEQRKNKRIQNQSQTSSVSKLTVSDSAPLCLQIVSETEPRHLDSSYLRNQSQTDTKESGILAAVSSQSALNVSDSFVPIVNLPYLSLTQEHKNHT